MTSSQHYHYLPPGIELYELCLVHYVLEYLRELQDVQAAPEARASCSGPAPAVNLQMLSLGSVGLSNSSVICRICSTLLLTFKSRWLKMLYSTHPHPISHQGSIGKATVSNGCLLVPLFLAHWSEVFEVVAYSAYSASRGNLLQRHVIQFLPRYREASVLPRLARLLMHLLVLSWSSRATLPSINTHCNVELHCFAWHTITRLCLARKKLHSCTFWLVQRF